MSTWAQATDRACQRVPERSRCAPEAHACKQARSCAMRDLSRRGPVIDASVSIYALGFCPMFLDSRGPMTDDQLGPLAQHSPPDVAAVLLERRQMLAKRSDPGRIPCTICGRDDHTASSCPREKERRREVVPDSRARFGEVA